MPDNAVLIGFSGTGKSTVGLALARRLGWGFVDTDDSIVKRFGRSIAALFREEGEAMFRAVESETVAEACAGTRQVISVGGGAPVDPANRLVLSAGNFVVRLEASPDTILRRLRHGVNAEERPMVAGPDPLARIVALRARRAEAYAIADLVVSTEEMSVDRAVDEIVSAIQLGLPRVASL